MCQGEQWRQRPGLLKQRHITQILAFQGATSLPEKLGGSQGTRAYASLPTHRAALGKSHLPVPQSLPVLTRLPLPSLALAFSSLCTSL